MCDHLGLGIRTLPSPSPSARWGRCSMQWARALSIAEGPGGRERVRCCPIPALCARRMRSRGLLT
eukprot:5276979-Alexandrium_andersonii.AAC.1